MPVVVSGSNGGWMVISGSNSAGYQVISGSVPVVLSGSTVTLNSTGVNALHVDSTGKVGIGTTSPAVLLELKDEHPKLLFQASETSGNGDSQIAFKSTDGTQLAWIRCDASSNALNHLVIAAGSDENDLVIDGTGKIGIGVQDPDSQLEVLSTSTQLKLSYDDSNASTFTVASDGDTTWAATDAIIDASGDIILDAAGDTIDLKGGGTLRGSINVATADAVLFSDVNSDESFRFGTSGILLPLGHKVGWSTGTTYVSASTSTGNLVLSSSGDIYLDSDGGQVYIKDNKDPHFLLDCDNTAFTIYDDQDTGDLFKIQVAQHGATTISTVDDDADNADLYFNVDGDIELDTESGRVAINNDGSSAFDFETTSGSFKIWTRPQPGAASGIAANHSAWASLKVAGSGSTTLTTFDSEGANADLTFDVDGDINLDAGAANINFKHGGTAMLSVNLDSTASTSPYVDFRHSRGATLGDTHAAIRFQTYDGVFNAASADNGAYGGWMSKKTMTAISGSDLNLSSMHVTSAMGYSGGIFKLTQTQASNGGASVATITLPTAVNTNQAFQFMGYHFRAMIVNANVGSIKIARGDETNDYLFGYINDASSNGTPGAISFDGTGPSGDGKDFLYFSGSQCVVGDYVDIVCVGANASMMQWVVTGMAST